MAEIKRRPKDYNGPAHHDGTKTDQGLSMKQEAYCRARAMGMSIQESCTAIGDIGGKVTPSTAQSWEKKYPPVSKRILELSAMAQKNAIINTGLDREWVISRLMSVTERCMQAEAVLDKEGEPTGQYEFDSAGATRALELLGKTINLFDGKDPSKDSEYANLSDDDLARIAQELAAQTGLLEAFAGNQTPSGDEQALTVYAVPEAN
jgi:phage terminase small subunit